MLPRRQLLAASTTTLPLFLALSACGGPDPLAGPPPLSADVRALLRAVTAEQNLISLYKRTVAVYSALAPALTPLLADRAAALAQLRTAEQAASSAQLRRLAGASPSLAQLYASIATSEATHVTVLD